MYDKIEQVGEALWKDMRSWGAWLLDDPYNSGKVWRKECQKKYTMCVDFDEYVYNYTNTHNSVYRK
jgi:N12 class adenine-specific DNA methylase